MEGRSPLLAIQAYGFASHLDYQDAIAMEEISARTRHPHCSAPAAAAAEHRRLRPTHGLSCLGTTAAISRAGLWAGQRMKGRTMHYAARHPNRRRRLASRQGAGRHRIPRQGKEVVTSQAGRAFVIAGADRLIYRVHWHPLDSGRAPGRARRHPGQSAPASPSFEQHGLAQALACGQLFTVIGVPRHRRQRLISPLASGSSRWGRVLASGRSP